MILSQGAKLQHLFNGYGKLLFKRCCQNSDYAEKFGQAWGFWPGSVTRKDNLYFQPKRSISQPAFIFGLAVLVIPL